MYGLGKLKINQFCVTPLPAVCFTEQVDYLKRFHDQFRVVLKDKFGVRDYTCFCAVWKVAPNHHFNPIECSPRHMPQQHMATVWF